MKTEMTNHIIYKSGQQVKIKEEFCSCTIEINTIFVVVEDRSCFVLIEPLHKKEFFIAPTEQVHKDFIFSI